MSMSLQIPPPVRFGRQLDLSKAEDRALRDDCIDKASDVRPCSAEQFGDLFFYCEEAVNKPTDKESVKKRGEKITKLPLITMVLKGFTLLFRKQTEQEKDTIAGVTGVWSPILKVIRARGDLREPVANAQHALIYIKNATPEALTGQHGFTESVDCMKLPLLNGQKLVVRAETVWLENGDRVVMVKPLIVDPQ